MEAAEPYFTWYLIALLFWGIVLINLYTWEKWYLSLVTLALFAIPSAFIAALILDQIKAMDIYLSMERQAQRWEIIVMAIAIVEATTLAILVLISNLLGRPKVDKSEQVGSLHGVVKKNSSMFK